MLERIQLADACFQSMGADVRHGGHRAYYTTTDDHIQMPPFQAFTESVVLFNAGA
jgi:antirestriction protein ArdC